MITVETFENDDGSKDIYYRNVNDIAFCHVLLDSENRLIRKYLSEYDDKGKILSDVVYGADHEVVLAFREYDYHHEKQIGYTDYRVVDGQPVVILKTRTICIQENIKSHSLFYDRDDKPIGYQVFEYDENCGMVSEGCFDMEGKRISPVTFPVYDQF